MVQSEPGEHIGVNRRRHQRLSATITPVLWVGVIVAFSLTPDPAAGLPGIIGTAGSVAAHAGEFLVLGMLIARTHPWHHRAYPFLMGFVIALTDELIQSQVPGRDASVSDVLTDLVGVALGLAAAPHVWRLLPPLRTAVAFAFLLSVLRLGFIYLLA